MKTVMIKTAILGAYGKMGRLTIDLLNGYGLSYLFGVDSAVGDDEKVYKSFFEAKELPEIIIDFSSPKAVEEELEFATKYKIPLVLCTTGYGEKDIEKIEKASKIIPILKSGNYSEGVFTTKNACKLISKALPHSDIHIVETHHRFKQDSPSGTAIMLAEEINDGLSIKREVVLENAISKPKRGDICISSIRGGNVSGIHTVEFFSGDEIITVTHTALSKKIFAVGAINGAKFLITKQAGLYSENDLYSI